MMITRLRMFALIGYVALIFVASSIPSLVPPGPELVLKDKIAHFFEYGVLGALLFQGIGWGVTRARVPTFGFLLAVGASVGALDEIYQSFVPHRAMDIYDWIADVIGVAAGSGIFVFTRLGQRELKPQGRRHDSRNGI